ncbi:M20 family metallopeptidase [Sediminibacterium sp.]|uniref:M20 metallopeptidase family protein n=1 Tax=Sediminibacterium sp. TaxID=1917865 RepID=UPI00273511DC|nr:M20 family metallopeptidase [Sediminibacterium sp.]MDP3392934.1 M20 family metallopeptidase [Sediminibacterium sp.]MDP3567140.1 M20 family metallopeptidase [Sediminibacterium sp.]
MLKEKIKVLAHTIAPDLIGIRHHLHANPELSYQEFKTSAFVQDQLTQMGIGFEVKATTGIMATVKGNNPDARVIALRADMDALPIQEENDVSYQSLNNGVMHACGHDVHTTVLLGAARILNELRSEWDGTIKLLFQPGEERNPGGASYMIKEGVLDNPRPAGIVALHVHPGLDVGKLSFRKGRVMASADEIYITIKSKGGHAAAPHLTADTVLIASQLIVSLQQIISRNNSPISPSVLSICSIQGGNTTNVIPSEVKLMGTFRAMDEIWRYKAHELIRKQAIGLVESMGAEIDLHIDIGYPTVDNDPDFTEAAWQLANNYMGNQYVEETELRMGAEDFGYYTQVIPGCFFRLGVRNESKGIIHQVHTPKFDIDESAIEIGAGMMAYLGISLIK